MKRKSRGESMSLIQKVLLSFLCLGSTTAWSLGYDWTLKSSQTTYTVSFPLKTVHGKSSSAKGKGHCENSQCNFLVAVPVKSFDSGDGNRDAHMWETTKAAIYPMATVRFAFKLEGEPKQVLASVDVEFAGKKNHYSDVPINLKWSKNEVDVQSDLKLLLSAYSVERPTLLGVAISDEVPVHIQGQWTK